LQGADAYKDEKMFMSRLHNQNSIMKVTGQS